MYFSLCGRTGFGSEEIMFITRESDYAVRVIRCLAGGEKRSVSDICEQEMITAPFAYKILKKLEQAGIVHGFRGVHGGYSLLRSPSELTLLDVYRAIDPDMVIIECMELGHQCVRDGFSGPPCRIHRELEDIQKEIWKLLARKNLQQILDNEEL